MSFTCYLHGWSSHIYTCPSCCQITTSSSATIEPACPTCGDEFTDENMVMHHNCLPKPAPAEPDSDLYCPHGKRWSYICTRCSKSDEPAPSEAGLREFRVRLDTLIINSLNDGQIEALESLGHKIIHVREVKADE